MKLIFGHHQNIILNVLSVWCINGLSYHSKY